MSVHSRPRAVFGAPLANASNPAAMLGEIRAAFDEFRGSTTQNFQNAIDDINARIAAMQHSAGGPSASLMPEDPEYSRLFANWSRSGSQEADVRAANLMGDRANIRASMSSGSAADGGYLAPNEWDRQIYKALRVVSPMRRISTVKVTSVGAYTTLWNTSAWGTGWVGETAGRPATGTPTLSPVIFGHGEIYANPAVTQTLLDDAQFKIEDWIGTEVSDEFAKQEDVAFVAGDGTNKPKGFLTYVPGGANDATHPAGALTVVPMGHDTNIQPDTLISFSASLPAAYRQNANWLMNSQTAAKVATLKDGQGNYLWRAAFLVGQPATLLGFPVEIDENMPNVAEDNLPIAFGDFARGYLINDRTGTRILRDPYTNKPYVHFYTTKRVGGGVLDPNAIRVLKMAVS